MPPSLKRATQFVCSVIPSDVGLLFLCGCILLFIPFQLRWWPAGVTGIGRHIGPHVLYTSDSPVLLVVLGSAFCMWSCWSVHFLVAGNPASTMRFFVRMAAVFPGARCDLHPLPLAHERPLVPSA